MTSLKTWFVEWLARHGTALAVGEGYDAESNTDPNWQSDGQYRNALIHAHVSAEWTSAYGAEWAEWLGDRKEQFGSSTAADEFKDQFNNEVGRLIAGWMETNGYTLANYTASQLDAVRDDLVVDALDAGHLIVDSLGAGEDGDAVDARITNLSSPTWTAPTGSWSTAAASRDYTHDIPGTQASDAYLPADWLDHIDEPAGDSQAAMTTFPGLPKYLPTECVVPGWVSDVSTPFHTGETTLSPLVLDIDASGTIELAALNGTGSVYWDIDSDDFSEASGWMTGGDGVLCILGGNGIVDDQSELFGNDGTYANGYLKLDALYDSNNDNAITSADTSFGNLRVWVDADADGYSDAGELFTLSALGITSIATSYSNVNYTISGNQISQDSTFTMNGNSYTSVDAWFSYDNVNSEYAGEYTLDLRTLFLPTLRGYGTLPDLHISMSEDETLLGLVRDLAVMSAAEMLHPEFDLEAALYDILHRWAGVDGVSPGSRGQGNFAQELGFLEALLDEPFIQTGNSSSSNPEGGAKQHIANAWQNAFDSLYPRLLLQTSISEVFSTAPAYDPTTDVISGTFALDLTAIENLIAPYDGEYGNLVHVWKIVFGFLDNCVGLANLSGGDETALTALVTEYAGTSGLTFAILESILQNNTDATFYGTSSGETLLGTVTHDALYSLAGNDIIDAGRGNDYLIAADGNDVLDGGKGTDALYGGTGDDIYVYAPGDGTDTIYESLSEGTDSIRITGNVADYRMYTGTSGELVIQSRATGTDTVTVTASASFTGGLYQSRIGEYMEQIVFNDATVSLTGGLTLEGSSGAETLYGTSYNDTLYAVAGNDNIYGNSGNDSISGGAGNDNQYGGLGNDTFAYSSGDGTDTIYESLSEGTDSIQINGNVADYRMYTGTSGELVIQSRATGTDTITVTASASFTGGIYQSLIGQYMEQIVFNDATVSLTGGLTMEGSSGAETLYGTAYNDTISAVAGNDNIYGNSGNDSISGGTGNDNLYGGIGNDTYAYSSGDGEDWINESLSEGTDSIQINGNVADYRMSTGTSGQLIIQSHATGTDTITVSASVTHTGGLYQSLIGQYVEQIVFNDATVSLTGGLTMEGTNSVDVIYGTTYGDTLYGMAGSDYLYGNSGNDILYGGGGSDNLDGGAGADVFVYEAASAYATTNYIANFNTSENDALDVSDLLGLYDPLNDAITDFVQITTSGSNSLLSVDRDGTATTYGFTQIAQISGVTGLTDEAALVSSGHLVVV